jgi:hypothetical protein
VFVFHGPKLPKRTVSRRVVINPRSNSSESCFHVLHPKVDTLTKKKHNKKALVDSHFFGIGLQSRNFRKNHGFFRQ